MRSTLMMLQETTTGPDGNEQAGQSLSAAAQFALVVVLIAAIAAISYLIIRTGLGRGTLAQGERSWLDYGNLYVVALGIAAVIVGFVVILLFLGDFDDITQALAFLTALFGVVTGLVGTYFGVKNSADAREGAEKVAIATGAANATPTVTLAPAAAPAGAAQQIAAGSEHTLTATVINADGAPATGVPVNFTVTAGPDAGATGAGVTDGLGRATFAFTNNGTPGTDSIEASSIGGRGTATVAFT